MMQEKELLIVLGLTPLLVLITFMVREFAKSLGIVNNPNPIVPQHTQAVAYMGGVAIAVNIFIIYLVFSYFKKDFLYQYWLFLSVPFLVLGLYDDIKCLSPAVKFINQLFLAVLSVYFLSPDNISLYYYVFSVFWIILIINAYNFLDVMDGLVGGVAIIFFMSMLYVDTGNWHIYVMISLSILSFMFFNFPPASIYMGDAGSHFLGFIVAVFTLNLFYERTIEADITGVLLVIVPLFELVFITTIRIKKGLPWWKGSPDHIALRLQKLGLNKYKTNFILWFIATIMSLSACFSYNSYEQVPVELYFVPVLLLLAFSYLLLKLEVKEQNA